MNGRIDWQAIHGKRAAKPPTFSDAQIAAAVAAAQALPAKGDDPNVVATPWDRPKKKKMPTIADVDFRDITQPKVTLATLLASNKTLDRNRLVWHCQNPGQPKNPSVFTTAPMVLDAPKGQIIIDGHHRLAALQLLGATSWPCWLLPSK